ncbi:uroporphyrin-III C-methyltransferase/precorrin-2 dehydrogenase/sirohydrochlorin ferrochelatase [Motilibacter peucedani]|uniref:Uroporphyrin-III C-methyltransferase/precorrin-2 dehydrogenase/sirohydrochlorin ferrochelatase n=1 Tax=Motilibacter peucedani TaxID=598650 RepID=A0A420XS27_9ACTN|nr:uroporphyrinogen-III C-methyltransferase [Motilibacter peucedani]RKS77695.1 uroporphyrin-III C-methyltransferase/precorrin-2 dehydrogenase/sirohydrochlorin ferrochelatase [Motilibacter peucedani]
MSDSPEPSPDPGYPLLLGLAGRRALVVGGGPVALRRVRGLLDARADVLVVAPDVIGDLRTLAESGAVTWRRGDYEPADLAGAWLVQTATGSPAVDSAVAADAERARVWCVRADDAAASTAWTPAVSRRGDVVVAVSGGRDPRRARALRDAVALALDTGSLPLRRHRPPADGMGSVALVGGGPGDPGLLTTRGRRLLAEADVVVTDRLAPLALLDELDDDVVVVDVGKQPGNHPVPQRDIERLLVEHARAGRRVVRLKGGDPYVFGRGPEELAACRAAGVPVEVVPGVTSAVAVPAAEGIPVTSRGLARSFTVSSGHDLLEPGVAGGLAALLGSGGTLVLLMGVTHLGAVSEALRDAGADAALPVAVVESGYTAQQRLTRATLGTVAEVATQRGVRAPAVVVVGAVAAWSEPPRGRLG